MNCAECQEHWVACIEGLPGDEESLQCQAHLETCAVCREEYAAVAHLHQQLVERGQAAADLAIVEPVMRRILHERTHQKRNTILSKLLTRWKLGLTAAVGAAATILLVVLALPKTQATAAEVMANGAKAVANLTSIHLRGQVRRGAGGGNFAYLNPASEFVTIELWKQFKPDLKWRVQVPGDVIVMDGQSTMSYDYTDNVAYKLAHPTQSAFSTDWIHKIADLSNTINDELKNARAKGWKMDIATETAANGRLKSVVTIEAKSGLPDGDYLKNKFFDAADTRRIYRFDAQTALLEAVHIYLTRDSGGVAVFVVNRIDCNQPIDPAVFRLELPANVTWWLEPQKLPDNEKYAAMTAQQAARALFEACGREDWTEAQKFFGWPLSEDEKQYFGGIQLISLGEPFTSQASPGNRFVPYEVRLKDGKFLKHNLAISKDQPTGRWLCNGGTP